MEQSGERCQVRGNLLGSCRAAEPAGQDKGEQLWQWLGWRQGWHTGSSDTVSRNSKESSESDGFTCLPSALQLLSSCQPCCAAVCGPGAAGLRPQNSGSPLGRSQLS